jgi:hypothetical protein
MTGDVGRCREMTGDDERETAQARATESTLPVCKSITQISGGANRNHLTLPSEDGFLLARQLLPFFIEVPVDLLHPGLPFET